MTLQIEPPRAGTLIPVQPRQMVRLATISRDLATTPAPAGKPRNEPLDPFARRAYASAGTGILLAAAAAIALHDLDLPWHTLPAKALLVVLVTGVTMFVGGAITGSARPRSHFGGDR